MVIGTVTRESVHSVSIVIVMVSSCELFII